jgi:hypothetical protein
LFRRLGGPQSRSGRGSEEKNSQNEIKKYENGVPASGVMFISSLKKKRPLVQEL